ncbi:MAG: hypothetical protein FD138_2867, partial [Planctomycetota bacterium]
MQSGNSIWKLTALAGCVGLGLLGLMQFQRNMTPKQTAKPDQKISIEDFKPLENFESTPPKGLSEDPPEGNTEPRRLSLKARRSEPVEDDSLDSAFEDFPPRKPATARTSRQSASRESFDSLDEDLSSMQVEPSSATKSNRTPRAELTLDEFAEEPAAGEFTSSNKRTAPAELPAFDEDPKPVPLPQNARKQAQELIKLSRKLLDDGLIDEARVKAAEAADLPATFGPLEDTPEAVLAEIDRLTASDQPRMNDRLESPSQEPISLTGGTKTDRGLTLDLDEPSFDEMPIKSTPKKSPLDDEDNLFVDSPPKTINGKARTPDLPVPPAEDPLDFPPVPDDADARPAVPIKARHKTDDSTAPNRLKSTNASPLELSEHGESVAGDGTLRADAPRGPQRPELKIEKIAPPNATLNQPMVYTIVIRNVGDSAANAVVVEDQIPMGTKLSGTIPRAELTGKKLIWRLGTIKPGDLKEIQVKVVPVAEGQVGSVATVNFTAEVASRTTIASPKLSVKLTAAPQVRV